VFDSAQVPVIDMSSATGQQLVVGLQEASCVFLTGLGSIPREAIAAVEASRAFFSLSEREKALVQWSGAGPWEGWQPLYAGGGDSLLLERFEVALPNPDLFGSPSEWVGTFARWPEEPASLATSWGVYYRSLWALTERIIAMIIDDLGLPADDLAAWTEHQFSNLCVNHYLAQDDAPAPGQVRQKAHTDHGGLTLLWADGSPGLEAQLGGGAWRPIVFPPDALLLQAGDLLHLWSRGTIPANNHRVANPPRGAEVTQVDRYSMVFFHHPDLDTWVQPPSADAAGIRARDHVMARQRVSYSTS
jgi:isopenicillin N synthase-like dioxygenase